ncbi:MAG: MBL fold metallo-hydrolase [Ignisphaera sp.]|uniref:Zn-dependent hydrolase n=1 Tax=Ignisphaera aggregans TaxID=334771 RepID=A0A7C4NKA1_9CREN
MPVIRWHGHACFEIVSSKGKVVVIDPHDGRSLGLKPPQVSADVVLITHEHFDHNAYANVAKPNAKILSMSTGEAIIDDIKIVGVETYHDRERGKRRGKNVVYKVIVDEVSIVHLGDLGHAIDQNVGSKLKPIDVLLTPVGGVFTIDAREAWNTIEVLSPTIVIPMHYWVQGLELPLKPVGDFLNLAPSTWNKVVLDTNTLIIDKSGLKPKTIYVLKY